MMHIEIAAGLSLLTLLIGYMIGRFSKETQVIIQMDGCPEYMVAMDTRKTYRVILGPEEGETLKVVINPQGSIHKIYRRSQRC